MFVTNRRAFFSGLQSDDGAELFTERILSTARRHIPEKYIYDRAFVHPWLNDECKDALRRKVSASGTDDFVRLRDECSRVFIAAYRNYVGKTRDELKGLSTNSRGWWKLANSLLTKSSVTENIPPLQGQDDAKSKAFFVFVYAKAKGTALHHRKNALDANVLMRETQHHTRPTDTDDKPTRDAQANTDTRTRQTHTQPPAHDHKHHNPDQSGNLRRGCLQYSTRHENKSGHISYPLLARSFKRSVIAVWKA